MEHSDFLPEESLSRRVFLRHCRRRNSVQKGFGKEGDGTGRHFGRIEIVSLPELMIAVRPEHGTFYDGTAALNICVQQCNVGL